MKKKQSSKQKTRLVFLCLPVIIWFSLTLLSFPSFAFERKECFFDKYRSFKETLLNIKHKVGCTVNTLSREFSDDIIDLTVKVPNGVISVERWFYDNKWHYEHTRNNLGFKYDSLDNHIETITKGGVERRQGGRP